MYKTLGRIESEQALLSMLLDLPNKILHFHEIDGLAQMILHDIAHEGHFGFKRASYLIDSPEFDCLRGVAGYAGNECHHHKDDLWTEPSRFLQDMQEAEFHNTLITLEGKSVKRAQPALHADLIRSIATKLGMINPWVYTQELRYGNHGILIVEEGNKPLDEDDHELLTHVSAILGLCHA